MSHDQNEINKFNNLAHEWWNEDGAFKTLHHINPIRLEYIKRFTNLKEKHIIDIGCGGGILAESLAAEQAHVTAIDLAPQSIEVAKMHLYESGLNVNYQCIALENMANTHATQFDVLSCMEMLEHVPNPNSIISDCAKLLKGGGLAFFSTLNRTLKSYLFGVIGAEYILKLIPKGTHEYAKFITPAELSKMLRNNGFKLLDLKGVAYNPWTKNTALIQNTDINYMLCCKKI